MKSLFKFFTLALLACSTLMMTSCGDDDGPTIDTGGDLQLGDGFYLAAAGADPVAAAGLSSEPVEDDGFAAQDRSGFVAGYMFLAAGNYNLTDVKDKEISATLGGDATVVTDEGSACDFNDYTLVSNVAAGGAAINVATDGLYKVSYDPTTAEMVMYQIIQPSVIGNATPNGWGADTPMTGSATADGGSFSVSGVELRAGEFKMRFNCRWTVDRRLDSAAGFGFDNGYQMFNNFGGTASNLETGGSNIPLALEDEGIYTITANWSPTGGWSLDLNKTGDVAPITFDPAEHRWGAIGDATANGWDADRNMYYKGEIDGAHTWLGVITLADAGEFKFRINDDWFLDIGGALTADGTEVAMDKGGANIASPGAGAYYVTIKTADEGDSWTASMSANGWGIIGAGSPVGNWDADMDLTADGFDGGITTYTITGDFVGGEFKFRAGDAWDYNLGGDMMALEADGGNLNAAAGTQTATLTYDGETYSVTVQ